MNKTLNLENFRIPVEVYSRVVGYYRPVNQWNRGKREEFRERVFFHFDVKTLGFESMEG